MNIRALEQGFEIRDKDRVFTLESKLGEGGQGICYRADFHGGAKTVKLIQTSEDLDEKLRPRLLELNAALGTRYRIFRIDPVTFGVVGDYYEGKNLREVIDDSDRVFTEEETKEFLLQMCRRWLGPLYSRRLIHHDIKPENIIVNDGIYSLIDFGGVRSLDSKFLSPSVDDRSVRSFGYSRFWGERSVQDDLYSVAKVVGFMLTGEDPRAVCITDESMDQRLNKEFVDSLKIGDRMKDVLRKMLSVTNPYSVPEEIVMDLEERNSLMVAPKVLRKIVFLDADVQELRTEFEREYLQWGPLVKPLSDDFKARLGTFLIVRRFVLGCWSDSMRKQPYYRCLGDNFHRKLVDKDGYDNFFYLIKGNFYFGLVRVIEDWGGNYRVGNFNIYVPRRLKSRRGKGVVNNFVSEYSSHCWDNRILEYVLSNN
jgi:serine/threonine protein kinase